MSRTARKYIDCDYVHVMVQGINKEYIFNSDEEKKQYIYYMFKFEKRCNVQIVAYCIMGNHAHLLIHIEKSDDLANYMKKCNQSFAEYYNMHINRVGVLFKNRYKSEVVYDLEYLKNCIRYIHNNPVKARMVIQAIDYPYSSCQDYVNQRGIAIKDNAIKLFGKEIDYGELIKDAQYKVFLDTEEDTALYTTEELISMGINEFIKVNDSNLCMIFSDKKIFLNLIDFLMKEFHVRLNPILEFFGVSLHYFRNLKKGKKIRDRVCPQ